MEFSRVPAGYHNHQEMYNPVQAQNAEFSEVHSVLVDGGDRFALSTVAFDNQEELLWMGNQGGHVTSYYSLSMQKYTSFQVHQSHDIRQILPIEHGILCLTQDTLKCVSRFGRPQYLFQNDDLHNMQCMLHSARASTVILGGHQPNIIEHDYNTNQKVRTVEIEEPGCAIMRMSSRYICAGDTSGKMTLRDPNTLKSEHVLDAHTGTLSDFDVRENLLVTCGFATRMGSLTLDRYMKVYDLRVMRAVAPLQAAIDPFYLRFVSEYPNRIVVCSQSGQFQLMDTAAVANPHVYPYQVQTEGAMVMAFDISQSFHAMAFGDSGGYLHLFAANEDATYNRFSHETVFADHVEPQQPIHINDELVPYGIIPMVYNITGKLLTDMSEELTKKVIRRPNPVDPEILRTVKYTQNVGYAPNPGDRFRNQVPYDLKKGKKKNSKQNVPDSPSGRCDGDDPFLIVPKKYRRVEIKYSKLGLEDFDFRHYNKTNWAGLETHIPNAYCNAMLQVLYFIEPLRCAVISHLCPKESCLACELGFLFHMLDLQKGQTCQANNFLRAFRTIPEASGLGLILGDAEESTGKVNYPRLIQSWNRFVLQQIHSELINGNTKKDKNGDSQKSSEKEITPDLKTGENAEKPKEEEKTEAVKDEKTEGSKSAEENNKSVEISSLAKGVAEKLFCTEITNTFCCRCGEEMSRRSQVLSFNLSYPDCLPQGQEKTPRQYSFSDILQQSLSQEQTTQAWCNNCSKYQPHTHTKYFHNLPDVLDINCQLDNTKDLEFWRIQQDMLKKPHDKPRPETSNVKPCRYGLGCTRKDCKFSHNTEDLMNDSLYTNEPQYPAWVPYGIKVTLLENGQIQVENRPKELDEKQTDASDKVVYYDLMSTVGHIHDPKSGGNLVSHIEVGETYHRRKEKITTTQWYLFNDFAITPIERHEAVHFSLEWKIPCVLYFMKSKINKSYELKITNPITVDALLDYGSIVSPQSPQSPHQRQLTFTHLNSDELPAKDDIVGLDAEFVTLNQEEAEIRSDGTKSTIKPSQMTVARITCVRGSGDKKGQSFLDDYISTQEQVVDYLTQFSGIKPGDLDANFSSKHLTTLKSTYVKLRYLVDSGVIFVGHGLKKDFRVINIVVPKEQVIDTVSLFHLPKQRMLSLKFLAWYFLNINIQSVTHDSIEDAGTALKLYEAYCKEKEKGPDSIREMLKELYENGRKLQWKMAEDGKDLASALAAANATTST